MTSYKPRFICESDAPELVNLYHLAQTALAGERPGRWERMRWAARQFSKAHPEVPQTAAYKDLEGLLA